MDKTLNFKKIVKQFLIGQSHLKPALSEIKISPVIDDERGHYLLFQSGWHDNRRTYGCYLHIDVSDDKIIVQHNGTDLEIADELINLGAKPENIVLEFHPPYSRKHTGFAVA